MIFDFVGGSHNSSTTYHSANMTPMTEVYDYENVLEYVKSSDQFDELCCTDVLNKEPHKC